MFYSLTKQVRLPTPNLAEGVDFPETRDRRAPETPLRFVEDKICPRTPKKPKSVSHPRTTHIAKRLDFEENETAPIWIYIVILLLSTMYVYYMTPVVQL